MDVPLTILDECDSSPDSDPNHDPNLGDSTLLLTGPPCFAEALIGPDMMVDDMAMDDDG